jgi:hypothetical protein
MRDLLCRKKPKKQKTAAIRLLKKEISSTTSPDAIVTAQKSASRDVAVLVKR